MAIDSFTIRIDGLSDLDARLRAFGPKIAANGLRAADYAATKVIYNAVVATAPVRSGLLKANIVTFKRHTDGPNVVRYSIGLKGVRRKYGNTALNRRKRRVGKKYQMDGPAFYGKFLEYGSSRMRPHEFLRPQFLAHAKDAVEAFRARMEKAVAVAAKKAGQ